MQGYFDNMDDKALKELLAKYRQGTCTDEELALLENWVSVTTYPEYVISEKELQQDFDMIAKSLPLLKPKIKLWPSIAVAAAAVAAITLGIWLYNMSGTPRHLDNRRDLVVNDVAPGSNGATLSLANGKVINLSDVKTGVVIGNEKLAYDDGTDLSDRHPEFISGSRAIQALTATTAKGQTYQFTLPDGTKVWLNADSKISFPSQFTGKERKILLSGEGYFEVAKDKAHPFIVESGNQEVEVLGTHFNISAYQDERAIKTTLLEGSIKIRIVESGKIVEGRLLKPNEQSEMNDKKIMVTPVAASYAVAWKEGYFMFNSERLETAMNKIARWYNLTIDYDDASLKEETIFGTISKYENVSKVLKMFEKTGVLIFQIEGRSLIVKRSQTKN